MGATEVVSAPGGRVELRLAPEPASIPQGRRHAVEVAAAHLAPGVLADFELLISEVLTNAVRHGGGEEVLLALTPKATFLCVQVTDGGGGFVPVPRAMDADEVGGFGLFLVEHLTRRWGMTRERGRTRVWFELDFASAS